MDQSGPQSLNTELTAQWLPYLEQTLCVAAAPEKIIPLVTAHKSPRGLAWSVAVEVLYNRGLIHRMYMFFRVPAHAVPETTISRLKATSVRKDETYSVASFRPTRILISCSSSKTTESPKE